MSLFGAKTVQQKQLLPREVSMMNNLTFISPKSPQNPHFGVLNKHFKPNMWKIQIGPSYIFRSVYQTDMKFDRQLRPARETSWVVSYGGKIVPKWRTAAILKIVISPELSQRKIIRFLWHFVHSSRFWTGWTSRDQKWKSCIGQTPSSTERISCLKWVMFVNCENSTAYRCNCCAHL